MKICLLSVSHLIISPRGQRSPITVGYDSIGKRIGFFELQSKYLIIYNYSQQLIHFNWKMNSEIKSIITFDS